MKTIIAGSRTITDYATVLTAIKNSQFVITEVITGLAEGPDTIGMVWGINNHLPIKKFPALWNVYGKQAGFLRNIEMLKYADALIAIWDGKSKGTKHTINSAKKFGILTHIELVTRTRTMGK